MKKTGESLKIQEDGERSYLYHDEQTRAPSGAYY